jgi:hypothetical protein
LVPSGSVTSALQVDCGLGEGEVATTDKKSLLLADPLSLCRHLKKLET